MIYKNPGNQLPGGADRSGARVKRNRQRRILAVLLPLSCLACCIIVILLCFSKSESAEEVVKMAAEATVRVVENTQPQINTVPTSEAIDAVEPSSTDSAGSSERTPEQLSIPPESELFGSADYLRVKPGDNLFAVLPSQFTFSSGAGGWRTRLNIYEDGSFDGDFRDWDMGELDEDYLGGTCYLCDFSGVFSSPQKVSDYVYAVSVQRLNYPRNTGVEWIEDGVRYIQSEPYGLDESGEYYIYLPGCPYSVFTEEQRYYISQRHENIPQGRFGIYARDGSSRLGFWGTNGNCIFSNTYAYYYGALKSELQPDSYVGKSRLVFWPEDGAATCILNFDWTEDSQRTFVAEDEKGTGEYDVNLYVTKDMQSVFVSIQSRQGASLETWGGTPDGQLTAIYSRKEDDFDLDVQEETECFRMDKSEAYVGAYVRMGSFEQDNNTENGKEPIEWQVLALDQSGQKALLLSRYALTARCYHNGDIYPTWADSDIREWLNGKFLRGAFTEYEQAVILRTDLSTPAYEGIEGGSDTKDRVFLLSRTEAAAYFPRSVDRLVEATEYARANGVGIADENGCCWWWLRTPGTFPYDAGLVYAAGDIDRTGGNIQNASIAVRPALWVELS